MATFGYSTGDLTLTHTIDNYIKGLGDFTPASDGTGDKISVRLSGWGAGEKVKCCLYWNDSGTYRKVTNGETEERTTGGTTGNWFDFDFLTGPTISTSVAYIICVWSDSAVNAYRKTSGGAHKYYYDGETYGAWGSTISLLHADNYEIDIYCTYNGGGAALTHTCSDTMTISDSIATASVMKFAKADTMTIGDAIGTKAVMKHAAADTMAISDAGGVVASLGMKHAAADTMNISDSATFVLSAAEVAAIKRTRMIYGLKPARITRIGGVGP